MFGEVYRACSVSYFPVTSSVIGQNIFLSALFINTLSLRPSLSVRYHNYDENVWPQKNRFYCLMADSYGVKMVVQNNVELNNANSRRKYFWINGGIFFRVAGLYDPTVACGVMISYSHGSVLYEWCMCDWEIRRTGALLICLDEAVFCSSWHRAGGSNASISLHRQHVRQPCRRSCRISTAMSLLAWTARRLLSSTAIVFA